MTALIYRLGSYSTRAAWEQKSNGWKTFILFLYSANWTSTVHGVRFFSFAFFVHSFIYFLKSVLSAFYVPGTDPDIGDKQWLKWWSHWNAFLTLPRPSIPDAGHFKLPTSIISGQYYPFLGFLLLTVREQQCNSSYIMRQSHNHDNQLHAARKICTKQNDTDPSLTHPALFMSTMGTLTEPGVATFSGQGACFRVGGKKQAGLSSVAKTSGAQSGEAK